MKIKKIILRNGYKRFYDLTIDLGDNPSKIIALVGPNGSGKSSVIDGMLYLQAVRHSHIGASSNNSAAYHFVDPATQSKWHENMFIDFDKGDLQTVLTEKGAMGKPKTLFAFRSPYRYSAALQVSELSAVNAIIENNIGASATNQLDNKVTDNYKRLYSLIDRVNKAEGSALTYKQAKDQIIGSLNESLEKVLDLSIFDHGDILDGRGTLFFKKKDQTNKFDFNVLSSGEKEVVDILIDFYLKREDFNDSIYIIDEPELHINTNIQGKLLNEIIKIIPENCQLWIATHSIGFLNALKQDHNKDSAIIWFQGKFSTEKMSLSPLPKTRENWKMVFRTALEDLTGLISPKTIIYCEGRKDPAKDGSEQGLDAEVYNMIFEDKYPEVLFVSSGGNTEPDKYSEIALTVLGKAFDSVNLILLKDKDINATGTPTTDEQRSNWLAENPAGRRMLERKEIENYLFDNEILAKANPTLVTTDYESIVSNIVDQNVKDKTTEVKKLSGFEQMNPEKFKLHLATFVTSETNVYKELEKVIFSN